MQKLSHRRYTLGNGSFARTGVAYGTFGQLSLSGQPRIERIGGKDMVLVEEATTNLLTDNQASVETDLTGFSPNAAATIYRDTITAYHGTACLKIVTNGVTGYEGATFTMAATPLQTYTFSVWLKGAGVASVWINERSSGGSVGSTITPDITLTSNWTRYTVTRTFGDTGIYLRIYIVGVTTPAAITFYADCLQLEAKPYATTWTLPSASRASETLTLPVIGTNLLTDNQASVETDMTTFSSNNSAILTRDTAEFCNGIASLKAVTPGNVPAEGFFISQVPVTPSNSYTFSVWLKGSGTVYIRLSDRNSITGLIGTTDSAAITLSSAWTRYSVTRTFASNGDVARLYVLTYSTVQAITFWADCLQLERGPAPSTWVLPSASKLPLGLPVYQGTVEGIVEVNDALKYAAGIPRIFTITRTGWTTTSLICYQTSSTFYIVSYDDAATYTSNGFPAPANGIYYYKVWWETTSAKVEFWNLATRTKTGEASIVSRKTTTAFYDFYLGGRYDGTRMGNTRFGRHKISNIAITADPDFTNLMPQDSNTVAIFNPSNANLT